MLKKDKSIIRNANKKYGKKHLIKEASDADVLKSSSTRPSKC